MGQDQENFWGFLYDSPPETIHPALTRQNNTSQGGAG